MTISYTLQPIPDWYFPDLTGKPLAGGKMYAYSSLNPSQFKPVFQDPSGTNQWPNPIIFSENGTAGPFYWELDTDNPDDLYFIQIFDSANNLVYSINQYPISGGSGGGSVNTVQNIENLVINSAFINNIVNTSVQPIANDTLLCPGAHQYLIYPDITFIQSGVSNAQDGVSFLPFTPLGNNPLAPDFATPYYLNYNCLNNPTGEIYKGIRIPISQNVNSIANQIFTFVFYARANSGSNTLNIQLLQYFGSGGSPSSPVTTNLTPSSITLTSSFAVYSINFSVPPVATKNLGNSNDDGTYLEILLPTGSQCNIDIAKPALYIGSTFPNVFYESVDETTYEIETPRTGDIKISMNSFSMGNKYGWIPLDDGTIGNSSSNATTRAAPDAFLLYKLIYENTSIDNCPLYNSSGVAISKTSLLTDWNANNQIRLPKTVGRVLADRGTGTVTSLSYSTLANYVVVSSTSGFKNGDPIMFSVNAPSTLQVNVIYYVGVASATQLVIYTSQNAALTPGPGNVFFADGTTGTISTPPNLELGRFEGESAHQLSINEMPAHNHPGSSFSGGNVGAFAGGSGLALTTSGSRAVNVASQGGDYPHNTMQPTVFYNMIIKL